MEIKTKNIALLITATANAVAVSEHVVYMMLSISKSIDLYTLILYLLNSSKTIRNHILLVCLLKSISTNIYYLLT